MSGYCFVVPVYNHGRQLCATLSRLRNVGLPIVVVDDGSNAEEKRLIAAAIEAVPAHLVTREVNGGKGAAVSSGMRAAAALGYDHAVQIDADGQHDTGDVPAMLALSAAQPQAVVIGVPEYDESAPRSRLYGRRITSFWVVVETWSTAIPDAMCGFRVYPLPPCLRLLDSVAMDQRMGFDIEILVRLYWLGVPFVTHPTAVTYPPDGTSGFRMVRDNLLISWTHTRLVFGMLRRAGSLAARARGR